MEDSRRWVGLMVDGLFHGGDGTAIGRELASVFGDDLLETRSVRGGGMESSTGEYYVFVRCGNYQDHRERLANSKAVRSVVPSMDSPYMFSDGEVDEFAGSAAEAEKPGELAKGDMVMVKDGYLKNLYGVVGGKASAGKYRVVFNFHLRRFSEILPVTSLVFIANVLKSEPKRASRGGHQVVDERHKLSRKKGGVAARQ